MNASVALKHIAVDQLRVLRKPGVDGETLKAASAIVQEVREGGQEALLACGQRFGDLKPGERLVYDRASLEAARSNLPAATLGVLERSAERIGSFASKQRAALTDMQAQVPGGHAGHQVVPVERAGCYAPGGRFPLPSSVLMTAVTARVAGVSSVWVASPKPTKETLAAAAIAGADALLAVGGAHAIAALAYGAGQVPACDTIVGPGNRWVTAAKQLVAGQVAIDMLAGPSELVVLADASAEPASIAADLLAQAEHDPDAQVALVSLDASLLEKVNTELNRQLQGLPTAATARASLAHGYAVMVDSDEAALTVCDAIAPEHLQLVVRDPQRFRDGLKHYGGLFSGKVGAEVFGDYAAGPNHTLPTGGTARFTGGLSVFHFLRIRTWLHMDDPQAASELMQDAAALARLEGLEAHARAADKRK